MVSEEKQGIWHAIWIWFYCKVLGREYTWREEWARFYRKVFGLKVDLSSVALPTKNEMEFAWLVVLAKELGDTPMNTAMVAARKLFKGKIVQYINIKDLDASVTVNDRDLANDSYAIRIRARVEADEENKGLTANDIAERNLVTMTLLERIVLELFYFWKFGKHLDTENWTLCFGSRTSDGFVPSCNLGYLSYYYYHRCFLVGFYYPSSGNNDRRGRSVVTD